VTSGWSLILQLPHLIGEKSRLLKYMKEKLQKFEAASVKEIVLYVTFGLSVEKKNR